MQSSVFVSAANKGGSHSRVLFSEEKGVCEGFAKAGTKRVGHFELRAHKDCLEF